MEVTKTIRILIVDDHPVVRAGLTSMLGTQTGMQVVSSAASGEEALKFIEQNAVDVMLLDLRMPNMGGIELVSEIKSRKINPAPRIIVLTSYETDEDVYRAVEAGVHGYLLKGSSEEEMIDAIRLVSSGLRFFPTAIAARLANRMNRASLTPREYQILQMLAKGLTNKEIGRVLGISENTARNHVNSIICKLEVSDRTEAATTAIQQGLISVNG